MPRKKKESGSKTLRKKGRPRKRPIKEEVVEEVILPEPDWPPMDYDQYIAITYNKPNGSLQVGGHIITSDSPLITNNPHGLPATWKILESIESVEVKIIRNPTRFKENLIKKEAKKNKTKKKVVSHDGVMWTGDTLYKTTGYGQFKKNEPKFGLSPEAVDELTTGRGRFKRVKRGKK